VIRYTFLILVISVSVGISFEQVFAENISSSQISIDVHTNQNSYKNGDGVIVLGMIQNYDPDIYKDNSIMYQVIDPRGNSITSGQVFPISNGGFGFKFVVGGPFYESTGNYKIDLVFASIHKKVTFLYTGGDSNDQLDDTPPEILQPKDIEIFAQTQDAITMVQFHVFAIDDTDTNIQPTCKPQSGFLFGIGETIVKCTAKDSAGNYATPVTFSILVNPPITSIPDWIKNVAGFWCEGKIDDASFVEAIQYLIDNDIIIIPPTSETDNNSLIPQWVKNNACWWSLGSITDDDFASGIQYLIKQGIIRV